MPEKKPLPTLKTIHSELTKLPATKRDQVLTALAIDSVPSFYDIINGRRKLNAAEKEAIAKVYERPVNEIDWQDEPVLVG